MKQRGIASFFGGKAENPSRTVKALSAKADELHTPDKHVAPEVLKDVNTSGTKRPREVINHLFTAGLQLCAHAAVERILHYLVQHTSQASDCFAGGSSCCHRAVKQGEIEADT